MKLDWITDMDDLGMSPLARASKSGRNDVATLMLMTDAQDHPNNFSELPALHRAACWGFGDVVTELIEEDGADPSETDDQGETALHKAVRLGNYEAATALVEMDADPNVADSLGMTPLHWAALTGSVEMTELLLKNWANVDARDYFAGGITPLGVARLLGFDEIATAMRNRFALM